MVSNSNENQTYNDRPANIIDIVRHATIRGGDDKTQLSFSWSEDKELQTG